MAQVSLASIEALLRQSAAMLLGDTSDPNGFARVQQLVEGGFPEAAARLLRTGEVCTDERLSYLLVTLISFATNIDDDETDDPDESPRLKVRDAITQHPGMENICNVIEKFEGAAPDVGERGLGILMRALLGSGHGPNLAAGRHFQAKAHKIVSQVVVNSPHLGIKSLGMQYLAFLAIGMHPDITEARSMALIRDGALEAAMACLMGQQEEVPHPEITARVSQLVGRLLLSNPEDEEGRRAVARHRAVHEMGLVEILGRLLPQQFETSPIGPSDGRTVAEATEAFTKFVEEAKAAGQD